MGKQKNVNFREKTRRFRRRRASSSPPEEDSNKTLSVADIVVSKLAAKILKEHLASGVKNKKAEKVLASIKVAPHQAVLHGKKWEERLRKREAEAKARYLKEKLRKKATGVKNTVSAMQHVVKSTKPPKSAADAIARLFEGVMKLKDVRRLHERLCNAGKPNIIPLRYLIQPPPTGPLNLEYKRLMADMMFDHSLMDSDDANDTPEEIERKAKKRDLLMVFAHYSSVGGNKSKCLKMPQFMLFLDDIQVRNSSGMNQKEYETLFMAISELTEKKGVDDNDAKVEAKHFGYFISRLAFLLWPENRRKDANINQKRLFNNFIGPNAKRARSDPVTLTLLFNNDVNKILDENRWGLWCVYKHFRSLIDEEPQEKDGEPATATPDGEEEEDTIDWDEFSWLLTSFEIVGDQASQLTWHEAKKVFNQANIGELGDDDVDSLSWKEFVECLCRIALKMFPLENDTDKVKFKSIAPTAGLKRAVKTAFNKKQTGITKQPSQSSEKSKRKLQQSPQAALARQNARKLNEMKKKLGARSARRVALFVFARKKRGYTQEEACADLDKILKRNPKYFTVQDAETIRAGIRMELHTAQERFGTSLAYRDDASSISSTHLVHTTKFKYFGKKVGKKKRFGMAEGEKALPHDAYLESMHALFTKASADESLDETLETLERLFHEGIMLYGQEIHNPKDLFNALDDDQDGVIQKKELIRAFRRLNINLKDSAILTLVNSIKNIDDEGNVQLEFFMDAITPKHVLVGQHGKKLKVHFQNKDTAMLTNPAKLAEKKKIQKENRRARNSNNEILMLLKEAIRHKRVLFNKQINSIKDIFDAMDADGSEFVEGDEIEEAFKRLGFGLSDFSVQNFVSHTDIDFDNKISYDEFEAVLLGKDEFTKLAKEQNSVLNSNRVHVYEAAQIAAQYLNSDTDFFGVVDVFESFDHGGHGTLELQSFIGAVKQICPIKSTEIEKILNLLESESHAINYLEFVHHLDGAVKQLALEQRREAMQKKLKQKQQKKTNARDQWDLVYEPPDPQPLFDESLGETLRYSDALKIANVNTPRPPPKPSGERDWSKVAVTTRIGNVRTGIVPDIDVHSEYFDEHTERMLNRTGGGGDVSNGIKNSQSTQLPLRVPEPPTGDAAAGKKPKPGPSRRQLNALLRNYEGTNGMFSPYKETSRVSAKEYKSVGVPVPKPIFTNDDKKKYNYSKKMKVTQLDMKNIQSLPKYSSPQAKTSRDWARQTLKERMNVLAKRSGSQSARRHESEKAILSKYSTIGGNVKNAKKPMPCF